MHLLQSSAWAIFKSQFGWSAEAISLPTSTTPIQVLFRQLPLGFNIAYLPKGPTINWLNQDDVAETLAQLKKISVRFNTIFLKIEPDLTQNSQIVNTFLQAGFKQAKPIQPNATIIIDIADDEAAILARMKSKTRYNIRLAARKGVTVRLGTMDDLATFHQLSQITSERDGFTTHSLAYYQGCYRAFSDQQRALLIAEYDQKPLAALLVFAWEDQAIYLYGASNNEERNKMPAYLLQWEAIKWAKAQGCHHYDLWGIPNAPPEQLEAEFQSRADGLWGVYRFKRGFGGQVEQGIGAFDFVHPTHWHKQLIYQLYTNFIARRQANEAI